MSSGKINNGKGNVRMKKGIVITPEDFNGVDWFAKMKELHLNTLGIHSGGGASHDVLQVLGDFGGEEFRKRTALAGLDLEYEIHAANSLLDRSLFQRNSALFPYNSTAGKRTENGNWCISNPETGKLLGENAVALSEKLIPSTHRHYFWSCDFPGGWCHCSTCAQMNASDQNLASVNIMAEAVRRRDPEAKMAYLAYLNHYEIPESVTPAEGVFLEFAPMTRCSRHAINDRKCAVNRIYWESLKRHLTLFDPAETHILEYWLDVSYYSHYRKSAVRPLLFRDILRCDMEAYMSLGIRSFSTFAVYMDGEYFKRNGEEELCIYADVLREFDS